MAVEGLSDGEAVTRIAQTGHGPSSGDSLGVVTMTTGGTAERRLDGLLPDGDQELEPGAPRPGTAAERAISMR
jgi:hypothetical protein